MSTEQWAYEVAHLNYPDLHARLDLIIRLLPRLGSRRPPRQWFFADVPIADGVLEVVQLHHADDYATPLRELVADGGAGLISSVEFPATPLVLEPTLFLNGVIPGFYVPALARHSVRAAAHLAAHGSPTPEWVVSSEISAIYAELIPRPDRRRWALELHARWLEQIEAPTDATVREAGGAHRDRLLPRATAVARLSHTQAVRLQSPSAAGWLKRGAALVRGLAG